MRDTSIVGSAITISGIQTGYYFTVSNSNVGSGVTSLYQDGSTLGIGTQFLDGVFEVLQYPLQLDTSLVLESLMLQE